MRGGLAGNSAGNSVASVRAAGTRRKGTINSSFMAGLAPMEVERNGSGWSVVADSFHQGSNYFLRTLFKGLPFGLRNVELLTRLWRTQNRSELVEDPIFDHPRRHRFAGAGTPSFLPGGLANVVPIPASRFSRIGGNHRPLAALADQQAGEQRGLRCANRSCSGAPASTKLVIDLLPYRLLDDGCLLSRVRRTPMFDFPGIDGIGEQPA